MLTERVLLVKSYLHGGWSCSHTHQIDLPSIEVSLYKYSTYTSLKKRSDEGIVLFWMRVAVRRLQNASLRPAYVGACNMPASLEQLQHEVAHNASNVTIIHLLCTMSTLHCTNLPSHCLTVHPCKHSHSSLLCHNLSIHIKTLQ